MDGVFRLIYNKRSLPVRSAARFPRAAVGAAQASSVSLSFIRRRRVFAFSPPIQYMCREPSPANSRPLRHLQDSRRKPKRQLYPHRSKHHSIKTTRIAGGLLLGYNPWLARPAPQGAWPGRPSRPRALDAGQPPEAAGLRRYLANGSSYSLTLSLSSAWSEASCSRMYFAMVASFRPTVET